MIVFSKGADAGGIRLLTIPPRSSVLPFGDVLDRSREGCLPRSFEPGCSFGVFRGLAAMVGRYPTGKVIFSIVLDKLLLSPSREDPGSELGPIVEPVSGVE